jgi:hypothetical protein
MYSSKNLPMTLLPKTPGLRLESLAIDAKTVSLSVASTHRPHVRSANMKAVGCTATTGTPFPTCRGAAGSFASAPSYSLYFNPIEEAFWKNLGRAAKSRSSDSVSLIGGLGAAISAVKVRDARNFFEHCGCVMPVQSL